MLLSVLSLSPASRAGSTFNDAGASSAGYALSFDGTNGGVTVPDSPSLQVDRGNAFTVALWAYFRRIDNNVLPRLWEKSPHFLCVMGDPTNPEFGKVGLEVANSSGQGNNNGGASEFWGNTRLQMNTWYFIAVTFDGSKRRNQAQIYLNGVPERMHLVYPWSGRMFSTAGRPWLLGQRTKDLTRGLDGILRSVVVYPEALGRRQIQRIYTNRYPRGQVADWELGEGSGTVAFDASGNGNDGAIVNGTYVALNTVGL